MGAHETPAIGQGGLHQPTAAGPIGHIKWLACIALSALWLTGACAKPPYDQLDAAEKTVREARSAGAPVYLPEKFSALEEKLKAAKDEISTQYEISEFSRDYSQANSLLAETRAEGDRIKVEAQKQKDVAKMAALQEKEQAEAAVHDVRELVERTKDANADSVGGVPDELKAEAGELTRTLAEVRTAIEADNHVVAKNKAKAVQEKSHKLQNEVQDHAPKPGP